MMSRPLFPRAGGRFPVVNIVNILFTRNSSTTVTYHFGARSVIRRIVTIERWRWTVVAVVRLETRGLCAHDQRSITTDSQAVCSVCIYNACDTSDAPCQLRFHARLSRGVRRCQIQSAISAWRPQWFKRMYIILSSVLLSVLQTKYCVIRNCTNFIMEQYIITLFYIL